MVEISDKFIYLSNNWFVKQLLALSLLFVHLFNLCGYTYLFRYLKQQSTEQITTQIDRHQYIDSELVEVKVALNLPYVNSSNSYERHEGEITIHGKHHNYVKRKVSGDTLYLLCLPNTEKDELKMAEGRFGTEVNDLAATGKKEMSGKKGIVFNQYQGNIPDYNLPAPDLFNRPPVMLQASTILSSYPDIPGRPPRSIS